MRELQDLELAGRQWFQLVRIEVVVRSCGNEPGVGRGCQVACIGQRARFAEYLEAVGKVSRQPRTGGRRPDDDDTH